MAINPNNTPYDLIAFEMTHDEGEPMDSIPCYNYSRNNSFPLAIDYFLEKKEPIEKLEYEFPRSKDSHKIDENDYNIAHMGFRSEMREVPIVVECRGINGAVIRFLRRDYLEYLSNK